MSLLVSIFPASKAEGWLANTISSSANCIAAARKLSTTLGDICSRKLMLSVSLTLIGTGVVIPRAMDFSDGVGCFRTKCSE